jgi:hypothetical protein
MGRVSKYTPECSPEAVQLHLGGDSTIAESAKRIGLHPETFQKWVRWADERRARRDPAAEARGAPAGGGTDPAEGGGVFRAGDRSAAMTYRLIDQERAHHAVSHLCAVLGVRATTPPRDERAQRASGRSGAETRTVERYATKLDTMGSHVQRFRE